MKWLLTLWLLLQAYLLFAQLKIGAQTEIMLNNPKQPFEVINLGNKGILACLEKDKQMLTLIKLDTALRQIWQKDYPINFELIKKQYSIERNYIHFLTNIQDSVYQIITINLIDGEARLINCINDLDVYQNKLQITHFVGLGNAFLFGGESEHGKPTVLYYHLQKQGFKVLPNINFLKAALTEITYNENAKVFSILLMNKGNFYYHLYNEEGKLLINNEIFPESKQQKYRNIYFKACTSYLRNEKQQLVVGTYANSALTMNAQGIYVAYFENYKHQETFFYGFNHFQNFHNSLDSIKKAKIIAKIKKKGSYHYDYEVFIEGLREVENQLLFSLKVFKKDFHNKNSTKQGISKRNTISRDGKFEKTQDVYLTPPLYSPDTRRTNRRTTPSETYNPKLYEASAFQKDTVAKLISTLRPIDGNDAFYLYYNTISCALDVNGKMLWDNIFNETNLHLGFLEGKNWSGNAATGFRGNYVSNLQLLNNNLFLHKSYQAAPNNTIYKTTSPFGNEGSLALKESVYHWYADQFIGWGIVLGKSNNETKANFGKVKIAKINIE